MDQTFVVFAAVVVFRFTLGPTRWKFCAFVRSRTTILYVFGWSTRTRLPSAPTSVLDFAVTVAVNCGTIGLPLAPTGRASTASRPAASSGRNICRLLLYHA